MKHFVFALVLALGVVAAAAGMAQNTSQEMSDRINKVVELDPENTLHLYLKDGRVVIRLRPEFAPNHVARVKELTRQGFYDGLVFHRVIDGFMAQTGDPTGTGRGGSGQNIKAEFSILPFVRGTVGMARAQDEDSADSQFFIMFRDGAFLDGKYTVFGNVVEGMQYVDMIKRGEPPVNPDKIVKMRVAADEMKEEEAGKQEKAAQ